MSQRSRAREVALQLLYQHDVNPTVPRRAVEAFARERLRDDEESVSFCLSLLDGVRASAGDIDRDLAQAAENWRLPRMPVVDRNVLRLGAYELRLSATPVAVILNEAIELARRFGTLDSPAFVNGVLDRLARKRRTPEPGTGKEAAPAG